jgi:hypothetical protein
MFKKIKFYWIFSDFYLCVLMKTLTCGEVTDAFFSKFGRTHNFNYVKASPTKKEPKR